MPGEFFVYILQKLLDSLLWSWFTLYTEEEGMDMFTVKQVSEETGVSIRTLRYYDRIGLLHPDDVTDAGYRLYGETAMRRLRYILVYRELDFSLSEIAVMLDKPDAERNRLLQKQIVKLERKREQLGNLITFARGVQIVGVKNMEDMKMNAKAFDEQAKQAKWLYGKTEAYQEYEKKSANRTKQDEADIGKGLMEVIAVFGTLQDQDPACEAAQQQVKALQDYITQHYYTCTKVILAGLGKMYAGGGSMTDNIDAAGGKGTAEFAAAAIEIYTAE